MRLLAAVALLFLPVLAHTEANPFRETMTQVSTIDSLYAGNFQGTYSFQDLKQYGDFGLGTLKDLDGELIILDGHFYRVGSDGTVEVMPGETTTPFITTTFFDKDQTLPVSGADMAQLQKTLDEHIRPEYFQAIRIDGTFSKMTTRSVPRQFTYRPLLEVLETQVLFEHENVKGTMVGIYSPQYVRGLIAVGYHFHFISEDRTAGGHVLAVEVDSALVTIDETTAMNMLLPKDTFDPGIQPPEPIAESQQPHPPRAPR